MSLGPTFVQSSSGIWYKDPEIRLPAWYICWDDDDPIELVIKKDAITKVEVFTFLDDAHWLVRTRSRGLAGQRLFDGEFVDAESWFIEQLKKGPPDVLLKGEKLGRMQPDRAGTYYFNGPNGRHA